MKKQIFPIIMVCMLLSFNFSSSHAVAVPPTGIDSTEVVIAEVKSIMLRLEEIKSIDKSGLKSAEKKELRNEVKTLKERLRQVHGRVYVSAGALFIIIILLLIILI